MRDMLEQKMFLPYDSPLKCLFCLRWAYGKADPIAFRRWLLRQMTISWTRGSRTITRLPRERGYACRDTAPTFSKSCECQMRISKPGTWTEFNESGPACALLAKLLFVGRPFTVRQ